MVHGFLRISAHVLCMCTCAARCVKSEHKHNVISFWLPGRFQSWSHVNAPAQKSSETQVLWSKLSGCCPQIDLGAKHKFTVVCFWTSTAFNAVFIPGWCKNHWVFNGFCHVADRPLVCSHSVSRQSCLLRIDAHIQRNVPQPMGVLRSVSGICPNTMGLEAFCRHTSSSSSLEVQTPGHGRQLLASRSVLVEVTSLEAPPPCTSRLRGAMHGTQDVWPLVLHRTDDRPYMLRVTCVMTQEARAPRSCT